MVIRPVFHSVSVLKMLQAQQSLAKVRFPVHQSGVSSIPIANNIAPIPTSHKLMGYSVSQLRSIDRSLYQDIPAMESVGTIVDITT